MTPEREDWLTTQYVWAIENERAWNDEVEGLALVDRFGEFRRRTVNYINATHKLVVAANESLCARPKDTEWAYIVLSLWLNKGGNPDAVLVDPGALKPHYVALLDGLDNERHASRKTEATEAVPNGTETQEENTMNQTTNTFTAPFVTKSYIYGKDVEQMTEQELINAIRSVETEIDSLKTVKTPSTKIAAKIEELQSMLAKIVGVLDGK